MRNIKNIKYYFNNFSILEVINILFTRFLKNFKNIEKFILSILQRFQSQTPKTNKFNEIKLSLNNTISTLCLIGGKYKTDKSPLNPPDSIYSHRHGYTFFYDLIFNKFINKKINIAELGTYNNSSTNMWREYFKNAQIYSFDLFDKYLIKAKKDKLQKVFLLPS